MQCIRVLIFAVITCLTVRATAQSLYSGDGIPTGLEEEIRWRLNRARFDSASENATRGTAYTDVPATSGPVAPNQRITMAARHQSEDLAKANLFQHATVPGSLYYNPTTQPNPWDRMTAEGYTWNIAAENIAAGYTTPDAAYIGWWNSTGHRVNMLDSSLREIGNGYFNWTSSTYRHYYTMDLGSSGTGCFFTDTTFRDSNGNGTYEQAEGMAGIAVRLRIGSSEHNSLDISSTVGSFAVPIQSIASGAVVQVILSNTTAAAVTLNIPRDYRIYTTLVLNPNESRSLGTFTRVAGTRNFGFRNITPAVVPLAASRVSLGMAGTNRVLSWTSAVGLEYQAQWTTNFVVWTPLTNSFRAGSGANMTQVDNAPGPRAARFYRVLTRRP